MKIIQLIPGAGNTFYCENCLRDNALAKTLEKKGHEILKVPLYLPFLTEEKSEQTEVPIFFGGINVYLQQKVALFRKTPRFIDRFFDSGFFLKMAANMTGMTRATDLANTTLSMLNGETGRQVKELNRLIDWLKNNEKPDIIHLSNILLLGLAKKLREELNVSVTCTLQDEDIFIDPLPEPLRSEVWDTLRKKTEDADLFIAVSDYYKNLMQKKLNLADNKIQTVYNGINLDNMPEGNDKPDTPVIGFLERQCPEKGVHMLTDAFILLKKDNRIPGLKLRIAGGQTADDKRYVRKIMRKLARHKLDQDVEFLPNLNREEKIDFLKSLTVLSVPAVHREAFGTYLVEAMAAGVPVVQPDHGAFTELINDTGGGVLCKPDDSEALAEALEQLINNPTKIKELGTAGRKSVFEKFSTGHMADAFINALETTIRS